MTAIESPATPTARTIPHIRRTEDGATHLIVKGKPFLTMSGELHNSSLSSAKFMGEVWADMKTQSVNTLLGSVTWEMIEPREGEFNFSELDRVLTGVREHDMHLVLLWFGTYKNGILTYAPSSVKRDTKRFPRVQVLEAGGMKRTLEMVSPLCQLAWEAYSRSFAALMRHLAEVDLEHNTVLMVQVENEAGLLGDSRDRSQSPKGVPGAHSRVPPPAPLNHRPTFPPEEARPKLSFFRLPHLDLHLRQRPGGRRSLHGARHLSSFIGKVAAAGKKEYPIPHYTNAWLNFEHPSELKIKGVPVVVDGGDQPAVYSPGGPCPHMLNIWRHNAPELDFLAPDLYIHDYETVCKNYTEQGNPLFIPEQRRDEIDAHRVWLSYATYGGLGASPFGIDTGTEIFGHRMGFFFDDEPNDKVPETWSRVFGDMEVIIERAFVFGKTGPGGGMIIHLGNSNFLAVGRGLNVKFRSTRPEATFTGILSATEKEVDEAGELRMLRVLNGYETRSGEFLIMQNDEPDYGGFLISVTIPARTFTAEVEAYWVAEDEEDR